VEAHLDLVGRLLIVACFLIAGIQNLTPARIEDHIVRLGAAHTPLPAAAFWIGIGLQFTGCALVLADWHAALGVHCLIVFTVLATLLLHRFWSMTDPMKRNFSRLAVLNNLGIVGGLLLLLENVRA
jgi:putative oxidoreductase